MSAAGAPSTSADDLAPDRFIAIVAVSGAVVLASIAIGVLGGPGDRAPRELVARALPSFRPLPAGALVGIGASEDAWAQARRPDLRAAAVRPGGARVADSTRGGLRSTVLERRGGRVTAYAIDLAVPRTLPAAQVLAQAQLPIDSWTIARASGATCSFELRSSRQVARALGDPSRGRVLVRYDRIGGRVGRVVLRSTGRTSAPDACPAAPPAALAFSGTG